MENWDYNAFYEALEKATRENTFGLKHKTTTGHYNRNKITKIDVCKYLSDKIGVAPETLKKWSNYNSRGPRFEADDVKLENLLNTQFFAREEPNKHDYVDDLKKLRSLLSDFLKDLEQHYDFLVAGVSGFPNPALYNLFTAIEAKKRYLKHETYADIYNYALSIVDKLIRPIDFFNNIIDEKYFHDGKVTCPPDSAPIDLSRHIKKITKITGPIYLDTTNVFQGLNTALDELFTPILKK